jgi:hypothetical protein
MAARTMLRTNSALAVTLATNERRDKISECFSLMSIGSVAKLPF